MKHFDYIVLGSGIAGLTFALKVAPRGRVAIITKKNKAESNTNYARGGIAATTAHHGAQMALEVFFGKTRLIDNATL
jgi:aspartate oxidase